MSIDHGDDNPARSIRAMAEYFVTGTHKAGAFGHMIAVWLTDPATGKSARASGMTQADAETFAARVLQDSDEHPGLPIIVCIDCGQSYLSDGDDIVEYGGRTGPMCENCRSEHDADVQIALDEFDEVKECAYKRVGK